MHRVCKPVFASRFHMRRVIVHAHCPPNPGLQVVLAAQQELGRALRRVEAWQRQVERVQQELEHRDERIASLQRQLEQQQEVGGKGWEAWGRCRTAPGLYAASQLPINPRR